MSNPASDALIAALAPYVFGGAILFYFYKKSQTKIPEQIDKVKVSLVDIKTTLPGVIKDKLTGVSEKTYVSQAQAKLNDLAALAAKRAQDASRNRPYEFPPFLYGLR